MQEVRRVLDWFYLLYCHTYPQKIIKGKSTIADDRDYGGRVAGTLHMHSYADVIAYLGLECFLIGCHYNQKRENEYVYFKRFLL